MKTSRLFSYIPLVHTLRTYNKSLFVEDVIASMIVTIMLIPQALAYALLAGLPPEMGLYASILPLFLYAIFGTSHAMSVGPIAVVSLMTATALGTVSSQYGINYIAGALTLAVLSGVFMLVLGILRVGFIANLLSQPVISGFMSATALMIAVSQIKHILGVRTGGSTLFEMLLGQYYAIGDISVLTLSMGALCILFLWWGRKHLKTVLIHYHVPKVLIMPLVKSSPVFAVIITIVLTAGLSLDDKGVAIIGHVPNNLPTFTLPILQFTWIKVLIVPACLIAIIGYISTISVGKALAAHARKRIDPNQELIALGVANIGSGLMGGFPITGGFGRSVVNFDAGAQTQVASILAGIGVLLVTLFLTPALYYLPKSTLAATIIVAVLSLVDFKPFVRAWRYAKTDFTAIVLTFLLTLIFGVEIGVLSGVLTSIGLHLIKTAQPHIAEVGLVAGTEHFRNIERHRVETTPSILSLRPDESLYFINANVLVEKIYNRVANRPRINHIIIQCNAVNDIDLSALDALDALNEQLGSNDIQLHFSEIKEPLIDKLSHAGFLSSLSGKIYASHFEAYQQLMDNKNEYRNNRSCIKD